MKFKYIHCFLILLYHVTATSQIYNYKDNTTYKNIWKPKMVKANSHTTISEITGPGVIKKIWFTSAPSNEQNDLNLAENVLINIYWENSEVPAISVPFSDFFCQSLKLQAIENHFFFATNNQFLFASTVPMPFRKAVKMEIVNNSERSFRLFFGIDIDFKDVEKDAMYLHTYWKRFENLSEKEPFLILPELKNQGRYLGMHLAISQQKALNNWPWYTRPVSIFLDASIQQQEPILNISTIDDFFGSAWWDREPEHNTYTYQYTGRPLAETDAHGNLDVLLYKYFIQESLYFKESIKIEVGKNFNWRKQKIENGSWTATSFLYLKSPMK